MTLGNNNGTDGQTDGQTDRQTECDAICGPLLKEEGRIIRHCVTQCEPDSKAQKRTLTAAL